LVQAPPNKGGEVWQRGLRGLVALLASLVKRARGIFTRVPPLPLMLFGARDGSSAMGEEKVPPFAAKRVDNAWAAPEAKGKAAVPESNEVVLVKRDLADKAADIFIKCPHICYAMTFSLMLLMTLLANVTGAMKINEQSNWEVHDAEATTTLHAYRSAVDFTSTDNDDARRLSESSGSKRCPHALIYKAGLPVPPEKRLARRLNATPVVLEQRADVGKPFLFIYKGESGGDVLTAQRLRDICTFERVTFQSTHYKSRCTRHHQKIIGTCPSNSTVGGSSHCRQDGTFMWQSSCNAFSPLAFFYGDLNTYDWSCHLLDSTAVEAQKTVLMQDLQANGALSQYSAFVGRNTLQSGFATVLRSMLNVLVCEEGEGCAADAGFGALEDSLFNSFDPPLQYGFNIAPHFGAYSAYEFDEDQFINFGDIRIRYWLSNDMDEYNKVTSADFGLAFFSIMFVWIWMWTHTGCCCSEFPGFMVASFSMLQIVCSLPLSAFVYRHIFMVDYFEYVHILIIYLVLGVGADDMFVTVDIWKKSVQFFPPDDGHGGYLDVVTLQRRLAHTLRLAASSIFNTSFTTTMAFVSCSVSKLMPIRTCGWYAAICIMFNYFLVMTMTPSLLIIAHLRFEGKRSPTGCCPPRCGKRYDETSSSARNGDAVAIPKVQPEIKRLDWIGQFFTKYYLPVMRRSVSGLSWLKPFPLFCVVSMLACGIQGLVFAAQLEPPTEPEKWFSSTHVTTNLGKYMTDTFLSADEDNYVQMTLFWGISGIDRSGVNVYRPEEIGAPEFASDFDVSTADCQQEILATCAAFRALQCNLEGCANDGIGTLVLPGENACFLEDFNAWLQQERNHTPASLPLTGSTFLSELRAFQQHFVVPSSSVKLAKYKEMIGIPRDARCSKATCFGEPAMPLFAAVRFRTTMPMSARLQTGEPVQDLVNEFVQGRLGGACGSSLKVHAGVTFMEFDRGNELIASLFSGLGIAGPVAFLVLLATTLNFVLAFFAIGSVSMVVFTVLGFCKQPMGWGLGIAESISGVIVIGLSVDYVVHLAHMYSESRHSGCQKREDRATFAIEHMGSTIFAGAITTAGAGSVMFLCILFLFTKMAVLITVTIIFSLLFALFFFVPLLFMLGPEGSFGDIPVQAWRQRVCGSRAKDEGVSAFAV